MKRTIVLLGTLSLILALGACPTTPPPAPPPPPPPPVEEPLPGDTEGPILGFETPVQYFSPDGDGENDIFIAKLSAQDESGVQGWSLDIKEPVSPFVLFAHFEGEGNPPAQIEWDGANEKGELVQSASDYLFVFTATDTIGNSATLEGKIETDILVIRDGDRLKVQVPSIVFAAEKGNFDGLDEETLANNERILRRIAGVLNKFSTYKVVVEGHANAVLRTAREENRELKPLSELRAKAVLEELVRYGVDQERLSSVGLGGTQRIVPYEDRDGWWKNRRVEFILIK
ncbi:MAG: OmpA family protein [Treponema sp.]|jgi:outer membrane protein OmpA-like peptidoglycan-associated protein|nr:OmpA family protein [Treponema sp.]